MFPNASCRLPLTVRPSMQQLWHGCRQVEDAAVDVCVGFLALLCRSSEGMTQLGLHDAGALARRPPLLPSSHGAQSRRLESLTTCMLQLGLTLPTRCATPGSIMGFCQMSRCSHVQRHVLTQTRKLSTPRIQTQAKEGARDLLDGHSPTKAELTMWPRESLRCETINMVCDSNVLTVCVAWMS